MFHFQGPKGFLAQVSEVTPAVRKQYNKMAVLHCFRVNSSLFSFVARPRLATKSGHKESQILLKA